MIACRTSKAAPVSWGFGTLASPGSVIFMVVFTSI